MDEWQKKFDQYYKALYAGKSAKELKPMLKDAQKYAQSQLQLDRITTVLRKGKSVSRKQVLETVRNRYQGTVVSDEIIDYLVSDKKNKGGSPAKLDPSNEEIFRNVEIISAFIKEMNKEDGCYTNAVITVAEKFNLSESRIRGIVSQVHSAEQDADPQTLKAYQKLFPKTAKKKEVKKK